MGISFRKMHGLGNDFVLLDGRGQALPYEHRPNLWTRWMIHLADRRKGVGCDQIIILRPSHDADVFMQIFNADGSEVAACGNATRCVAWRLMQERGLSEVSVKTKAGILQCYQHHIEGNAMPFICVNMGLPEFMWDKIPMSHDVDTCDIAHGIVGLPSGVAVNMGNPHIVIFVEDVHAVPLQEVGALLEYSPLFPERVNVTLAQCEDRDHIIIKTWERGAGETLACGTAACATMVAARRRSLIDDAVRIDLPGGTLWIEWQGTETNPAHPVWMTGEAKTVYEGILTIPYLEEDRVA
ncbi:MAG: diaminopimelate epimerase [Alphaproteobacteria bacterium]|nr:MAG: diaminopimelate epimerase [Alphaproteobacteria bacterium]